jgi:hypothetical protein
MNMKRNTLIVLVVLSALNLHAQFEAGNTVVSLNGNYMKTNTESGVRTNQSSTNGQYLNVGASYGYFVTNQFVVGIGLDYNRTNETRSNLLYFNSFVQQEIMEVKSRIALPSVYMGYYQHIFNKLYFNANMKFGYGIIKSELNSAQAGVALENLEYNSVYGSSSHIIVTKSLFVNDYFGVGLNPELTYFVSPKLGICLGLGGVEYSMIDWSSDNTNWIVNFNPNYWKLGIKIKL